MTRSNEEQTKISEQMVEVGRQYLSERGAVEEPSLVLYHGFIKHMLETTMEKCGEQPGLVTEAMQDRAIHYFSQYFDPQDPLVMTHRDFVNGLLTYTLLAIDPHKPNIAN
jgi:hypothetical protein